MAKTPSKGQKPKLEAPDMVEQNGGPAQTVIDIIPAEVHAAGVFADVSTAENIIPVQTAETSHDSEQLHPKKPQTSLLPLIGGGVIAGAAGFFVATLNGSAPDTTAVDLLAAQQTKISVLEQRITALADTDVSAALLSRITNIDASIADITARLGVLEQQSGNGGSFGSVESDMDSLRAELAAMTSAARTELETARATAAAIEENAAAAARAAAGRAALARIQTALQSGAPIGAALRNLEDAIGEAAPDALAMARNGVPTLASLQEQFPDVARAALATARREGVSGEQTTGIGAFLRNQFDVRSTTPRDGDGADAVLSRVEAAVKMGRLADALAEISALPEVVRADISDWLIQAETRANAVAAVDILFTSLSDN